MRIIFYTICLVFGGSLFAQEDTTINRYETKYEKRRYHRTVTTRYGLVDYGTSGLRKEENYRLENGIDPFELRIWKSTNFNIHFIQQRFSLISGHLNFVYGLTLENHRYFFDNPIVLVEDAAQATFEFVEGVNFKKNRLNYSFLTVPFMLNIKSNPRRSWRSLHLSAGGYAGVLLGANFKTKTKGDKVKTRDNFGLNTWRYGLRAEVGYGPLIFYGTFALSELFEEDKNGGYELNPYSIGLVIWPF